MVFGMKMVKFKDIEHRQKPSSLWNIGLQKPMLAEP